MSKFFGKVLFIFHNGGFMKVVHLLLFVFCLLLSMGIQAGTFWFPIAGHYPYSTNLKVTAVPDLDPSPNTIKTRLWQKGTYNTQTITVSGLKAFTKSGGGDWDFDGVRYNDGRGGTGKKYVWYDNHNGYDFVTTGSVTNPEIHAVESGKTCGHIAKYGQLCLEHVISGTKYQTIYTHMSNIPTRLKTSNVSVAKWEFLGLMSNVSVEPVNVHLHFVTKKHIGNDSWVIVDPYGHKPNWPNDTSDDPNNPYLWQ